MKESISKFITEGKALLWIKTNDFQEVERAMIESLNSLENKKFYIYEKGKTVNFLNDSVESGMDDLFNTLDELYPQGIRKIPVFLLIKGGIDEILKKNNLDYFREIFETKKEAPRYNFTVVIADNEDVPPQLEGIADFIDKQITDNEGAIKRYILDLAKFEKLELAEEEIEKVIETLKNNINKYSRNKEKKENISPLKSNEIKLNKNKIEEMIIVKGGKYQPSFADEEKEVFDIEVSKYQITQKMWAEVMGTNPSHFKGENMPVESLNWWEALEFCNKLSEKYGLEPVYNLDKKSNGILMIKELGGETVYPDVANFKNTEGFRLPTEVEWEWFARGGQKAMNEGTFDYIFAGSNEINEVAWYRNNTGGEEEIQMGIAKVLNGGSTQEVGLKKPNQLGIYDCSGNVWEWIYDTAENSHRNLENKKLYTYRAFDNSCIHRRIRGGGWAARYESCSVSTRYYKINRGNGWDFSFSQIIDTCNQETLKVSSDIGLRIVRTI